MKRDWVEFVGEYRVHLRIVRTACRDLHTARLRLLSLDTSNLVAQVYIFRNSDQELQIHCAEHFDRVVAWLRLGGLPRVRVLKKILEGRC